MKPLCEQTARVFEPIKLSTRDKLLISVDDELNHFVLDLYQLDDDKQRGYPSWQAQREFPLRFPERKRLDGDGMIERWRVGATDISAEIIERLWPSENRLFADAKAQITYEYLIKTSRHLDENAEVFARFREWQYAKHRMPDEAMFTLASGLAPQEAWRVLPENTKLEVRPELPLELYQRVGLHMVLRSEGFGLFMEQGTGKTPIGIAAVCNAAAEMVDLLISEQTDPRMYRVLVVCPKNVRINWQSEFKRFSTRRGNVTVLRGGQLNRIKLLVQALSKTHGSLEDDNAAQDRNDYSVVVCSYETATSGVSMLKTIEWDLIVLDESHFIKGVNTKRSRAMIRELRDAGKKRVVMTGTPIANTLLDMYAQFEFMGRGWSGFTTWDAFKEFYGVWVETEGGKRRTLVDVQNLPFMQERLARTSFIVHKKDVMPYLPDMVYDVYEVEMTSEQTEAYERLRDHLVMEIQMDLAKSGDKEQLVVNNILTKLLRLAEITSGYVKFGAHLGSDGESMIEGGVRLFEPNPKIEALIELMREKGPNEKTLIWACWTQDIKSISERLRREGFDGVTFTGSTSEVDRLEAEHRFNYDDSCRWFLGNQGAGGTGLNLIGYPPGKPEYKTNCNHEIFFSQDWSSLKRAQAEARCHRRGTREPVRCTDLCIPGTIDEEIRARVASKRTHAYTVSDVRQMLKSILKGGYSRDE
jgi:SNF2 family DNA or RNA helicase